MRAVSLLAMLALVGTAVAFVPSGQAMEMPPPCQTMTTCCGIEPDFAPCCSPLCSPVPPPVRCANLDVDTTQFLLFAGPSVGAETDSDCSANACLNDADCSDASCADGDSFCCSLQGTQSYCTSVGTLACSMPESPVLMTAAALPVGVGYTLYGDCTADVRVTMTCPAGFQKSTRYVNGKTVEAWVDVCLPITDCTCPPIMAAGVADPAAIDPFPTCVQDCFWFIPDGCDLQTFWYDGPVAFSVDPWGGDCDIDLEPIGACAPPSGSMVERHIGPVHLHLLLCGGDLPELS